MALRGVTREIARAAARGWDQFAFYEVEADAVNVRAVASDAVAV